MAVTELRTFTELKVGENAAAQCRLSWVKRDNSRMGMVCHLPIMDGVWRTTSLNPSRFEGPAIPDTLLTDGSNDKDMGVEGVSDSELDEETFAGLVSTADGEAWSEDSDSEEEMED